MVRTSKLVLAVLVLTVSAGIAAAYAGMVESVVSPDQLPGPPPAAGIPIFGVLVLGILTSIYLDRKAWRDAGSHAGLTVGGTQFASGPPDESDHPTLSGTVRGRPVRARTESVGGGRNGSSTTYTVVEAELRTPVEWHASFGIGESPDTSHDHDVDAAKIRAIDGVVVRGGVSEPVARAVLTPAVRDAVASVEGPVAVGDVKENFVGDMMDALDDAEGVGGALAKGMMRMASDGEDGPSRTVQHRSEGLVTDGSELRRRIDAVTTVAEAVDRTG